MQKLLLIAGALLTLSACANTPTPITPTAPIVSGPQDTLLSSGSFYPVVHPGSGAAAVVRGPDGKRRLEIKNLITDDGPAVYVWLSTADTPKSSASVSTNPSDYRQLSEELPRGVYPLNASYVLPDDLDLSRFRSVVLWCVEFKVNFASAALTTEPQ